MKATQQEVRVDVQQGQPVRVRWGERQYPVSQVLDAWRYGGRWWLGEPPRNCFLVRCGSLTAELHQETVPLGKWFIARIRD